MINIRQHRKFKQCLKTLFIVSSATMLLLTSCTEPKVVKYSSCKILLNKADSLFEVNNVDSALSLQLMAYDIAQRPIEKAQISTDIASTYYFIGNTDSTLNEIKKALAFFNNQTNPTYINDYIDALDLYADALMSEGNIDEAIEQYQKLSSLANTIGDDTLYINCQLRINENALAHNQYFEAIEGYKSLLKHCNTTILSDMRFNILRHLLDAYQIINDREEMKRIYDEMSKLIDDEYKKAYLSIAKYQYALATNDTATQKQCLAIMEQLSTSDEIKMYDELDVLSPIVQHFITTEQYDSAKYYFDQIKYNSFNPQSEVYIRALLLKAQLYMASNDIDSTHYVLKYFNQDLFQQHNIYYHNLYLHILSQCYLKTNNYKRAYEYELECLKITDSINTKDISHKLAYQDLQIRRDTTILAQRMRIQENQNTLDNLETIEYTWYLIIFIIIDIGIIIFTQRRLRKDKKDEKDITESKERLELEVERQTAILQKQRDDIKLRYSTLLSEIMYASKIQNNTLPKENELKDTHIAENFIFYQPCALISGDFYWFNSTDDKLFVCCGDATGHGIPGTFIAMVSTTTLNELAFHHENNSALALITGLDNKLRTILQNNDNIHINDTIDLSMLCIDKKTGRVTGVMARHTTYVIKKDGTLIRYQGIKRSIADTESNYISRDFVEVDIDVESGDCIYLASDGYESQFGGDSDKKLNRKTLEQYLIDIHLMPMSNQRTTLRERLREWQGDKEQTDDILIIGLRIK